MAPAKAMATTSLLFCAANFVAALIPAAAFDAAAYDGDEDVCRHPVMVTKAGLSWLSCGPDAPQGGTQSSQKAAPKDAWLWTPQGFRLVPDGMSSQARLALGLPLVLNRASAAELAHVPGLGPSLALRIVAYRAAHGPFSSPAQLQQVPGLGPKRLAAAKPALMVVKP